MSECLGAGATCRATGSGSPQQKHTQQKLCNSALYTPKHNGRGGIVSSGHVSGATHQESDFRPEGNQRHPSVLSSLYPSLPDGAGGVGSGKSPAKQVCSQVSAPFSVTPHLVFELPFWVVDGMVVLRWDVTVGKSAMMSGSPAEMCQFIFRWQSGPVAYLTSRDWSLIGTTHSLLGNCRLTVHPKDSHETPGKGYDSKPFLSLCEGNPIFWAEPHTSNFSLKDIQRKLPNRG